MYFSFKLNKNIDKNKRVELLKYIKSKFSKRKEYDILLSKAVVGLFNNPNFNVSDVDLIMFPKSSSSLNYDLANKISQRIPNSLMVTDMFLKNEPENVSVNENLMKEKGYKDETIYSVKKMVQNATIDNVFKLKKINPRFRMFVLNFLKLNSENKSLYKKIINGKILVVDDYISQGTTFKEVKKIIENYAPKEVILYSLIG
jgi:hypothetical protein